MKKETVICDACKEMCKDEYFTVFRSSYKKGCIGKIDLCTNCYLERVSDRKRSKDE